MKYELKDLPNSFIYHNEEYFFKDKHKTHNGEEPVFLNRKNSYWRLEDVLKHLNENDQPLYYIITLKKSLGVAMKIKQFNDEMGEIIDG